MQLCDLNRKTQNLILGKMKYKGIDISGTPEYKRMLLKDFLKWVDDQCHPDWKTPP